MTVSASMLRAMLLVGCSAEQIVAVVESDEASNAESKEKKREQNRIRQQNHRTRNASSRVTDHDDRDTPSSDKEKSPTPPKEINSSPESSLRSEARKRARRMPADYFPDIDYAVSAGLTPSEAKSEASAIRDWSLSSPNGAKLDWDATWRGWVKRALERRPRPKQHQTAFQQRHQTAIDAFDRKLGLNRNDEFASDTIDIDPADWRVERETRPRH